MFSATAGYGGAKPYGAASSFDQPQSAYYGTPQASYGKQPANEYDSNQNGGRPVSMNFTNANTNADSQQRPKSQMFGNQVNVTGGSGAPFGSQTTTNVSDQDYDAIRSDCLRNRTLYEDQSFPANSSSLLASGEPRFRVSWMRPSEICTRYFRGAQPSFMQFSRFDVRLGVFGDRWLLAAVSALVDYPELLRSVCQPGKSTWRFAFSVINRRLTRLCVICRSGSIACAVVPTG